MEVNQSSYHADKDEVEATHLIEDEVVGNSDTEVSASNEVVMERIVPSTAKHASDEVLLPPPPKRSRIPYLIVLTFIILTSILH